MSIPPISPYPMPSADELPTRRVGWSVVPARAAVLVHDMQDFFVDRFPVGASPRAELVEHASTLRWAAASAGVPVFFTAQPAAMSRSERGLLLDFWGEGMARAPGRDRVVPELEPAAGDHVCTKWRYSAFHRSDLEDRLRRLGRDQLVVCGVYAHLGVLMTAVDAFSRDIQPFVVGDAVADFTPEDHRMALEYAAGRCAVVLPTTEVLAAFAGAAGAVEDTGSVPASVPA